MSTEVMPIQFLGELGEDSLAKIELWIPGGQVETWDSVHAVYAAEINLESEVHMDNAVHYVISAEINLETYISIEPSSMHKLYATEVIVEQLVDLDGGVAIHKVFTENKYNAPVSPICRTYLHTPYESRILETPTCAT